MASPAHNVWRRAKLQVADDVRTRLEADIAGLEGRLEAIEAHLDQLGDALAVIRDAIEAQVDVETEANELLGRMLSRLAGSLERLEAGEDTGARRGAPEGAPRGARQKAK